MRCWLRAIPSVLRFCSVGAGFHSPFLMSEWKEVVNRRLHRHDNQSRGSQAPAGQR